MTVWMEEPEQNKTQNGARLPDSKITMWPTWKDRGNNEIRTSGRDLPSRCAQFAAPDSYFSWINYWKKENRCICRSPYLSWKGGRTHGAVQGWSYGSSHPSPPGEELGFIEASLGQWLVLGVAAGSASSKPSPNFFPEQIPVTNSIRGHPSFYYIEWYSYLPVYNLEQAFQRKPIHCAEKKSHNGMKISPCAARLVPVRCTRWINTSLPSWVEEGWSYMKFVSCLLDFKCEARTINGHWGFQREPLLLGKLKWSNVKEHRQWQDIFSETPNPELEMTQWQQQRTGKLSSLPCAYTSRLELFPLHWREQSEICTARSFREQTETWMRSGLCSCPTQLLVLPEQTKDGKKRGRPQ